MAVLMRSMRASCAPYSELSASIPRRKVST
jgi:hypothetical protein